MREAGRVVALVLKHTAEATQPGISTKELARVAAKELKSLGAKSAFLGYLGFPDVICISVNHQVVHGVPSGLKIREGDLVGLDFGASVNGMIADGAITVGVGDISKDARRLLIGTQQALVAGLKVVKAGHRVGDISHAIGKVLAQHELMVIDALAGHGVGHQVHEDPIVPNDGPAGAGMVLKSGMTLAIEPIASLGNGTLGLASDRRTMVTGDGSLSAQFEHTVLITDDGCEILTHSN